MSKGLYLHQWCQYRQIPLSQVSDQSGIGLKTLESVQNGSIDPSLSLLDTLAQQLHIPTAWLHSDPQTIHRLWNDPDEEEPQLPTDQSIDPIFERLIHAQRDHSELFALLTNLVHFGDQKLIRAAQVNLQSLSKQIRATTVPWGSRPSGHFEPPND